MRTKTLGTQELFDVYFILILFSNSISLFRTNKKNLILNAARSILHKAIAITILKFCFH